jgi:hypothetical protein
VPDNGNVANIGGLRHELLDCVNDTRLGIRGGLPASDAGLRLSKERLGRRFKLLLREVTRRRSVILAEVINDAIREPEPVGEDLCPLSRFALAAAEDATHPSYPGIGRHRAQPCTASLVERPIGNRDARINRDVRVGDKENRRHLVTAFPLSDGL